MLPAWATVAIALGSAGIGALAGVTSPFVTARSEERKLRHEQNREWRNLLIQACQGLSDSWLEVRWILHAAVEGVSGFDEGAARRLVPLGTRCAQMVAKARLVFGQDSPAGKAANLVDESISQLKDKALQAESRPWDAATTKKIRSLIEAAEDAHAGFLAAANRAIQPSTWSESSTGSG
jgi:hypothetical protein